MKTLLAVFLLACAAPARADFVGDFQSRVRSELIKPFALDLGGVLGAASVDPGRPLGFPGFEAGIVSGVQFRPDSNDLILRNSGVKTFGVPLVSAAVGLPLGFDVVAHGVGYSGAKIFGGGLRWNLLKAPVVGQAMPTAGVAVFVDKVSHSAFSSLHYGANVSAGWALPLLTPFVNAGLDLTKVTVDAANAPGVTGQSAWARGTRLGAGLDLTPFPFMRLRAAYEMIHGLPGATLDLLVKF